MSRNKTLENATADILGQQQPILSSIDLEFVSNSVGTSYSFIPFALDAVEFDFDYTGNVFTSVLVNIKVSGYDYALLQDQSQNLLATLKITPRATNGTRITGVTPFMEQYRVMLVNAVDARVATSDIHLHTEPTRNMVIRLIDPVAYRLRHEAVNACLHNATVSDMIHYLVHCHQIPKADIIAPDNTYSWGHMLIPSYPNFVSSIGYLQSKYGVYGKGCNYYIHDECLYVYPPFETSPDSQGSLTFYQSRTGMATLGGSKHAKAGDDYRIIIDTPAQVTDISLAGAENHGTGISFTRSARTTRGMSYIDPKKGACFTDDNTVIMNSTDPQTLDPEANRIKQIRSTSNPYPHLSLLAAQNAAIMTTQWDGADINAFVPGKKVTYCYDDGGVLQQRSGILERVFLKYTRGQRHGKVDLFYNAAALNLRLEKGTRRVI